MNRHEYFDETHQMIRDSISRFVKKEIIPNVEIWEEAG
ncbi:MAG: acyl-CoA dehydrogenase family protein [Gammaproteobacteria bacterium]|nr:acyl-CoA dehydrogenase family protein [Gammaproteobacteria bacterium]